MAVSFFAKLLGRVNERQARRLVKTMIKRCDPRAIPFHLPGRRIYAYIFIVDIDAN